MVPSKSTYPIDITQIPKFNQDQLQMAEVLQKIDKYLETHSSKPVAGSLRSDVLIYIDEAYKQTVDMWSINKVIDADYHCRKVIFPTHQQDNVFYECYSRSRHIIRLQMKKLPKKEFLTWWGEWREINSDFLEDFHAAWYVDDKSKEPNWKAVAKSTNDMIEALVTLIETEELYDPIKETDK